MNTEILQSSEGLEHAEVVAASAPVEHEPASSEFANTETVGERSGRAISAEPGPSRAESERAREEWSWTPEGFAREQLRGLVQRTFFSGLGLRSRDSVLAVSCAS